VRSVGVGCEGPEGHPLQHLLGAVHSQAVVKQIATAATAITVTVVVAAAAITVTVVVAAVAIIVIVAIAAVADFTVARVLTVRRPIGEQIRLKALCTERPQDAVWGGRRPDRIDCSLWIDDGYEGGLFRKVGTEGDCWLSELG
jgi:hypothetical protein